MNDYRLQWRFRLEWERSGSYFVDPLTFDEATQALRAHAGAAEGRWVQPGYERPRVSALEQLRICADESPGRRVVVSDVLRPPCDVDEVAARPVAMTEPQEAQRG